MFSKDISNASLFYSQHNTLDGVKYKINGIDFTAYGSTLLDGFIMAGVVKLNQIVEITIVWHCIVMSQQKFVYFM